MREVCYVKQFKLVASSNSKDLGSLTHLCHHIYEACNTLPYPRTPYSFYHPYFTHKDVAKWRKVTLNNIEHKLWSH
jgi:hypothetical protein